MLDYTTIVVAVLALAGSLYSVWQNRKRPDADVRAIDTETYNKQLEMINTLRDELVQETNAHKEESKRLRAELAKELENLKEEAKRLRADVLRLEIRNSNQEQQINKLQMSLELAQDAIKYLFEGTVINIEFMEKNGLDPPFRPRPQFRGSSGDIFDFEH